MFRDEGSSRSGVHRLSRRCGDQRGSTVTEIAEDTFEFRDPDPFFEVGVRPTSGSSPGFIRRLGEDDDPRRRRLAANLGDQARVPRFRDALVQDDGVRVVVRSNLSHVDVGQRDREQLEPRLLHEELHEGTLQGDGNGDEDPECRVRPSRQTRFLG